MKKLFFITLILMVIIPLVSAVDFVPTGNIVGKNVYSILNFTSINGTRIYENGSRVLTSNSTFPYSSITGVPLYLSNFTNNMDFVNSTFTNNTYLFKDDQRYNDSQRIDALNLSKLDSSDQRYNDTLLIQSVNTSNNIKGLGFNLSSELKNWFDTLYYGIGNALGFLNQTQTDLLYYNKTTSDNKYLDKTDQRYNETARVDALNLSKRSIDDQIEWTNLTGYPVACPANNFMTQVGDTITCTSVQETLVSLLVGGNLTVNGWINDSGGSLSRYNDSAAIDLKLDKIDQRYNETARVDTLNLSKLDATDQRYNDTIMITSVGNWSADKSSYNNISADWANDTASFVPYNGATQRVYLNNQTFEIMNTKGANVTLNNFVEHTQEMMTDTLLDKSRLTLSASGGVLNYTLIAFYGCGQFNFGGVLYPSSGTGCVTNATISLLNGTDANPKHNYVYWELVGGIPTMKTAESAGATGTIPVAEFSVGTVSGSTYTIYSYSRSRSEVDTFVNRVLGRFEDMGAAYKSGFTTTTATKNIKIATGYFYNGIFQMYTNVSLNSSTDGFYRINSTGSFISATTFDSNTFNQYQTGESVADNRYINVVWGIVPTSTTTSGTLPTVPKLVAIYQSKPGTEYNSAALAEQDLYEMTNYYPSDAQVKEVFVPIARTIVLYRTGGGGTGTLQAFTDGNLFKDIRGKTTSSGGAPSTSNSNHAVLTNLDYASSGHTGFASSTDLTSLGNSTLARTGNCPAGEFVANTTLSGVQCIAPAGGGTVTQINSGVFTTGGAITSTGTIDVNMTVVASNIGNWSLDKSSYTNTTSLPVYNNLSMSEVVAGVGNWSLDKPSYVPYTDLVNSVGNWSLDKSSYALITYVQSIGNWSLDKPSYVPYTDLVNSVGNWSLDKSSYATTASLTSVGNWSLDKPSYVPYTDLVNSVGNWSLDKSSYATIGSAINWTQLQNYPVACPAGTFVSEIGDAITCTAANGTSGGNGGGWTNTSTTTSTTLNVSTTGCMSYGNGGMIC